MRWTPEKIKALRKAYGEKQEEFRQRLGPVSVVTLSMWERGHTIPTRQSQMVLDMLEQGLKSKEPALAS